MANPEHLAILKKGVRAWNRWRNTSPNIIPNLVDTNLRKKNLGGVDFHDVLLEKSDLTGANLNGANLINADLIDTVLIDADLRAAILTSAIIIGTNLEGANLESARLETNIYFSSFIDANLKASDLIYATIQNVNLDGAYLHGAVIDRTIFADVDLSKVKGLSSIHHGGPSTIGIDTIYRSQGKIPEAFLRACEIPEALITYARSLRVKPIRYFTCMISYSSRDERFCKRFYDDLRAKDVQVWRFAEDAKWGEPVWGEIDRSIKRYDKLIVVCSKNSLTSGPMLREIERALNREDKEHKNILFPITIDRYLFDEWQHPRKDDVLAKVVGTDFIGWNRDAAKYDKAFEKLLKALKA